MCRLAGFVPVLCVVTLSTALPQSTTITNSVSSASSLAKASRDSSALDILTRAINASGGLDAISSVRDLMQSGQITLFLDQVETGLVVIHVHGTSKFRMEADLPTGKTTWIANGEAGSKQDGVRKITMPSVSAANLGGMTFPAAFLHAALVDQRISIRLIAVEHKSGRSVYRLRIQGPFAEASRDVGIEKDLVIDALTFDVVSINDQPLPMYTSKDKSPEIGPREINFGDYRSVQGIRIPFSITSSMHGQPMMKLSLIESSINTNVADQEFEP